VSGEKKPTLPQDGVGLIGSWQWSAAYNLLIGLTLQPTRNHGHSNTTHTSPFRGPGVVTLHVLNSLPIISRWYPKVSSSKKDKKKRNVLA